MGLTQEMLRELGLTEEQAGTILEAHGAELQAREDVYVRLARRSLETYIRTGRTLPVPEDLPPELLQALMNPAVEKWAFNAAFERVCLSRLLRDLGYLKEGEFLSPVSWR